MNNSDPDPDGISYEKCVCRPEMRSPDRPVLPPRGPRGSVRNLDRLNVQIALMKRRKLPRPNFYEEDF